MRDASMMCSPRKGAASEISAAMRGASKRFINSWRSSEQARRNSSEPHRSVGVELERGGLHAKKIGDADAFGFYERTPSLPYAISEDPGSSFTPTSMRRSETGFPPPASSMPGQAPRE